MEVGLHRMTARALDDEGVWSNLEEVTFILNLPDTPTPTPTATPSCSGVSFGMFRYFSGARVAQWINNTTYPGLEVTGITVNWDPLETASNVYGWGEYMDWMRWNSVTVHGGNPTTSTTSANRRLPEPVIVGSNANYIYFDFAGGFNGYLTSPPLNFTSSHFGFTVQFSDPACNLSRGPIAFIPPSPTPTPTVTGTPTITPPPPPTSTSTTVPTPTRTPTATNTLPPTNTPAPNCNLLQNIGTRLKNNHFDIRILNSNAQTAYLIATTLEWNTANAPPMYFDQFKFKGSSYGSSSYNSPLTTGAPNIGINNGEDRYWEAHFQQEAGYFYGFYRGILTFDFPGWGTCEVVGSYWAEPPPTPTNTSLPTTPTRTPTATVPPHTSTPTSTLVPTATATWPSFD
jgi:hypothetical protein